MNKLISQHWPCREIYVVTMCPNIWPDIYVGNKLVTQCWTRKLFCEQTCNPTLNSRVVLWTNLWLYVELENHIMKELVIPLSLCKMNVNLWFFCNLLVTSSWPQESWYEQRWIYTSRGCLHIILIFVVNFVSFWEHYLHYTNEDTGIILNELIHWRISKTF